jgi:L-ascorbate metabolism protein UlaG (beta-lactamase superfamily)
MATTTALKPSKLNIRAYQVGFGDCLLLTFFYPKAKKAQDKERHVLIDFGSTGMPKGVTSNEQMMKVAEDIKEQCDGKLHIVVASHRHKDHISGFMTQKDRTGTGDVIASLHPNMVIQPWTEDPAAKDPKPKSKGAKAKGIKIGSEQGLAATPEKYLASLQDMNAVSEAMLAEVEHLTSAKFMQGLDEDVSEQIKFLGDDNKLPNKSAVENLAQMGENHYVHYGYDKLNLAKLLPGVKVHVLGPPTLEQHAEILKERSTDKTEFWMLQGAAQEFWGLQAATGELIKNFSSGEGRLFPDADVFQDFFPSHDRWFIRQMRAMRGTQMLGLVRILDQAMNNTSVILLFEVGGKKLLFPGDAQIENWEYALKRDEGADLKLLKDVDLYKVGHHGSRNATPKTLWNNFGNKNKDKGEANRLSTIVSTMKGKHGHAKSNTEVPRGTLVDALTELSDYHTTENAAEAHKLFIDVEIKFTK